MEKGHKLVRGSKPKSFNKLKTPKSEIKMVKKGYFNVFTLKSDIAAAYTQPHRDLTAKCGCTCHDHKPTPQQGIALHILQALKCRH